MSKLAEYTYWVCLVIHSLLHDSRLLEMLKQHVMITVVDLENTLRSASISNMPSLGQTCAHTFWRNQGNFFEVESWDSACLSCFPVFSRTEWESSKVKEVLNIIYLFYFFIVLIFFHTDDFRYLHDTSAFLKPMKHYDYLRCGHR